jgi:hypothetical protein
MGAATRVSLVVNRSGKVGGNAGVLCFLHAE